MLTNPGMKSLAVITLLTAVSVAAAQQQDYFSNWPEGVSPQEVGKRVAEHFITSPHQGNHVFYGEVGTWYGALTFAHLSSDKELQDKLLKQGIAVAEIRPLAASLEDVFVELTYKHQAKLEAERA